VSVERAAGSAAVSAPSFATRELVQPSAWTQFRVFLAQGVRAELADRERILSPLLFAVVMLLLFSFALGDVDPSLLRRIYLAEAFITAFFALQIAFSRVFEPDRSDRVYDVLRTYPISHTAWFLAKYVLVLALGTLTLVPTLLLGAVLNQTGQVPLLSVEVMLIAMLALCGLAALGVLLSAVTLTASSRQILYPLLYFPLTTPVLLAAVQASLAIGEKASSTQALQAWGGLLLAFDVVYITLGILLFPSLVEAG
jgi:heme exporter protein B